MMNYIFISMLLMLPLMQSMIICIFFSLEKYSGYSKTSKMDAINWNLFYHHFARFATKLGFALSVQYFLSPITDNNFSIIGDNNNYRR